MFTTPRENTTQRNSLSPSASNRCGHGRSTRVADGDAYTWRAMGSDVLALLDHLGLERSVVGGLSLGANVALAFAATHADRLRAAIVEMPVLDEGRPTAERTFIPMAN